MRWSAGGAQAVYGVTPDLSTWGKALGNGFPISALAGRRDIMEYGGLNTDVSRVFLLSTTHGPEVMSLAAYLAVVQAYQEQDVVGTMERQGAKLAEAVNRASAEQGLQDYVAARGRPSCLIYTTNDHDGQPSQAYRTLFMQELLDRGVLGQSLVISAAHTDEDLAETVEAVTAALEVYGRALADRTTDGWLRGRPVAPALREFAAPVDFIRDQLRRADPRGRSPPGSARSCTSGWPSSTRSAAASPATAYGRPCSSIGREIPLEMKSVQSGTEAFDWTINDEWNVTDAYIADPDGRRLIDFRAHNLHLVSYSTPVRARMTLDELGPHLHTLPDHPDWIPYRTTYYSRTWGFCLTHAQLEALGPGPFDVVIDTTIRPGELSYGELRDPRRLARRGDRQRARLPPVAGQRQPVRHRRRHRAGQVPARPGPAALHLPLPVRTGHHRLDRLAQPESRRLAPDPARAGADRAGRRRPAGLQADPARVAG